MDHRPQELAQTAKTAVFPKPKMGVLFLGVLIVYIAICVQAALRM